MLKYVSFVLLVCLWFNVGVTGNDEKEVADMTDPTRPSAFCGVCGEPIAVHEHTLFLGGFANLVRFHTASGEILVHDTCAQKFETRSELLRFLTNGKEDLSYLE